MFREPTDKRVEAFSESVSFDRRLADDDIDGSIAHARMLAACGLMTVPEADAIAQALEEIRGEIRAGRFEFTVAKEDIHLHIESALTARLGDAGRKLHTARSRNDQVATDLRLYCRRAIDRLDHGLAELAAGVPRLRRAGAGARDPGLHPPAAGPAGARERTSCSPGARSSQRDRDRLADCRRRTNVLPLGSGALAGTSLPIDRDHVQEPLGFEAVAANSLDAASDRDFVCELAFVIALAAVHLSQWAEEWILYSTQEFGFLQLPEGFCTGSSIMPQKINPDVLELVRGKSAPGDRQRAGAARAPEGPAHGLQPRSPGRQGDDLRLDRHARGGARRGRAAGGGHGVRPGADRGHARPRPPRRHEPDGGPDRRGRAAADGPRDGRAISSAGR